MGQALRLSRTVPFPVCKVYVIVLILASRLPASVQRCLARMSHTARAPAVDDAADDDFAWVVARGSSTTGGCIGRRGLATSGKTPGEAFLAGARLLQGAAPQALSCGEALQALLEVGGARLRGPQAGAASRRFA